jgi:hypothetical protein
MATPTFTCTTLRPERRVYCPAQRFEWATGGASPFSRDNARLLYYLTTVRLRRAIWTYTLADGKSRQITIR